jgi:hypothetical protein
MLPLNSCHDHSSWYRKLLEPLGLHNSLAEEAGSYGHAGMLPKAVTCTNHEFKDWGGVRLIHEPCNDKRRSLR